MEAMDLRSDDEEEERQAPGGNGSTADKRVRAHDIAVDELHKFKSLAQTVAPQEVNHYHLLVYAFCMFFVCPT